MQFHRLWGFPSPHWFPQYFCKYQCSFICGILVPSAFIFTWGSSVFACMCHFHNDMVLVYAGLLFPNKLTFWETGSTCVSTWISGLLSSAVTPTLNSWRFRNYSEKISWSNCQSAPVLSEVSREHVYEATAKCVSLFWLKKLKWIHMRALQKVHRNTCCHKMHDFNKFSHQYKVAF